MSFSKRRVVVVGNGPVDRDIRPILSRADWVVRFNKFRSYGGNSGTRTDAVAVCNTGRPAKGMLSDGEWLAHPALAEAQQVLCVRDVHKFEELRPGILARHPDLDDFFEDFTDAFHALAEETGKGFRVIDRAVHERVDAQIALIGAEYVVPSSGMIVIEDLLSADDVDGPVQVVGFSHQGWELHPFAAERALVDRYVQEGRVVRL